MPKTYLILSLLAFAGGCSIPDMRDAQIVVKDDVLMDSVITSKSRWEAVTRHDIAWSFVSSCDSDSACITIHIGDMHGKKLGNTHRNWDETKGLNVADITIDPSSFDEEIGTDGLNLIMSHELGHALGLKHKSNSADIMRTKYNHSNYGCFTREDWGEYYMLYHSVDSFSTACFPQEDINTKQSYIIMDEE